MAKTRRSKENVFIGPGAVAQTGGALPLYICNDCGREVVWATSKKTGRKYLANISHGYKGQRFYIGANVHDATYCAKVVEDRERALRTDERARRMKSGLCMDCGEAGADDTRTGEPYHDCADCILDRRVETAAALAELAAEA